MTDLASDEPVTHLSADQLVAGLDAVRRSPTDRGTLELIVTRPDLGEREVHDQAELDTTVGLVGDNWLVRGSRHTPDGSAEPLAQLNIMNSRAIALISPDPARRPLAGDQLYLDLDLSPENLPTGTRLAIGGAVIEINEKPHRGCAKFSQRFGTDAVRFVNSPDGLSVRLRGVCATVVQPGTIRTGDAVTKLA
jgi:hypothetical protein